MAARRQAKEVSSEGGSGRQERPGCVSRKRWQRWLGDRRAKGEGALTHKTVADGADFVTDELRHCDGGDVFAMKFLMVIGRRGECVSLDAVGNE